MAEQVVKRKWNGDAKYALKFSKFCVWPLGLWPFDSENAFSWFRVVYSVTSQVWMIGTQLMAAYLNCGDATDNVDYVMMAVCAFMALSKIIAIRVHMSKVRVVLLSAQEDLLSIPDDETRQVVTPFMKKARTVFYIQMVSSYISNTLIAVGSLPFLMPPIANQTDGINGTSDLPLRQLPLQTGCMFAHYRNAVYAFFYVYETIMINCSAHGNVGSDVFFFTMAMYLCGQIELLKIKLSEIGKDSTGSGSSSRRQIIVCIRRHSHLMQLAETMNQTLSGMLVMQLLLNAGMNLMLGLRIIMAIKSGIFVSAIRPMFAFNVLMLQLYFLSYAGDRLSHQADSVLDAVYDSNWYELPPKLRNDVYFLAMRINKGVYLKAGQIYVMNLENFKNVLKASFSYFSILQAMFDA